MFINDYDIIVDKLLDDIYNTLKNKKLSDEYILKLLSNPGQLYKKNNSIDDLLENNNSKKELIKIFNNIIQSYILNLYLMTLDDISKFKSKIINNKIIDGPELGILFNLYNDCSLINELVNKEINVEELNNLYKTDIRYKKAIAILNDLGLDIVIKNLKGNKLSNYYYISKVLIFKDIYKKNYRKDIFKYSNIFNDKNIKYKYIEIVVPELQILDYNNIDSILNIDEKEEGYANDILELISGYQIDSMNVISNNEQINNLLKHKLIYPIVNDFLRYHKKK